VDLFREAIAEPPAYRPTPRRLDYLGFGIPPNILTWGNMLTTAGEPMSGLPLPVIAPDPALTLVTVCLHLVGDNPRDALDPTG
jgi:peptide/nickel transport system permease protein